MHLKGLSNAAIVTHQPATQVSLRTVTLPFTDSKSHRRRPLSTVEEMVPFDIDDLQIQHQILSIYGHSLVLITREDIIESHLDKLAATRYQSSAYSDRWRHLGVLYISGCTDRPPFCKRLHHLRYLPRWENVGL